jgi:Ca2+-binding RTX toxin-like protein
MTFPVLSQRPDVPGPPESLVGPFEPLVLSDGGQLVTSGVDLNGFQILEGTPQRDVIAGGLQRDFIESGPGSDDLAGGPERDVYRHRYGDGAPDQLIDFAAGGDRLQIGAVPTQSALARLLRGRPQSSNVLCEFAGLKLGMLDQAFYAYQKSTGRLFFNANRSASGWGRDGGLVANLPPGTPFSWRDLQFDYSFASASAGVEVLI